MFSSSNPLNQSSISRSTPPNQSEIIEIEIDLIGGIAVDPIGFQGAECEAATAPLYEVLGDVTDREYKPEYFSPDPNNHQRTTGRSATRQ
jgi:hypothetical protein